MKKHLYVSSKLKHADMWKQLDRIDIISSWIDGDELSCATQLDDMWHIYMKEIAQCDVLIVYFEDGEIMKGCLIEVGAAMMMNKEIHVIYKGETAQLRSQVGTWIYHSNVTHHESMTEFCKIEGNI